MTEYFTIELIATFILPIIATIGLMHSRARLDLGVPIQKNV